MRPRFLFKRGIKEVKMANNYYSAHLVFIAPYPGMAIGLVQENPRGGV